MLTLHHVSMGAPAQSLIETLTSELSATWNPNTQTLVIADRIIVATQDIDGTTYRVLLDTGEVLLIGIRCGGNTVEFQ